MATLYKFFTSFFTKKTEPIKEPLIDNKDNILEPEQVICTGAQCKNRTEIKPDKPKFPLCKTCVIKYSYQ